MRILAIDVGTGTQDIVLFDSAREPENCFKMVLPAPTQIVAARVRAATTDGRAIVLTGRLMGGGPVGWAIKEHLEAGLSAHAEPAAARTLNDDLEKVRAIGVRVLEPGDRGPEGALRLTLGDLDLAAIETALAAFGIEGPWDGLAVAVLDHGDAPPDVSDREFRFRHIRRVAEAASGVASGDPARPLLAFAYTPVDLPPYLTRMAAVAAAAPAGLPMALLDTGAAAGMGALLDPRVAAHRELVLVNVGNMHTLATHMAGGRLSGIVEHHTGRLTPEALASLVRGLSDGSLTHEAVFADHGHGCYQAGAPRHGRLPFVSVTGPRRAGLSARLRGPGFAPGSPHYAVPFGDMMTTGCWGLVRAFAHKHPAWSDEILAALKRA